MEVYVSCPYNQLHKIPYNMLLNHIEKGCKDRIQKGQMFAHCPYNYLHILTKSLLQEHIKNCQSRLETEMMSNRKKVAVNKQFWHKSHSADNKSRVRSFKLIGDQRFLPYLEKDCSKEIAMEFTEIAKMNAKFKNSSQQQIARKVLNRSNWKRQKEDSKSSNDLDNENLLMNNQFYDLQAVQIFENKEKAKFSNQRSPLFEEEQFKFKPPRFFNSSIRTISWQQQVKKIQRWRNQKIELSLIQQDLEEDILKDNLDFNLISDRSNQNGSLHYFYCNGQSTKNKGCFEIKNTNISQNSGWNRDIDRKSDKYELYQQDLCKSHLSGFEEVELLQQINNNKARQMEDECGEQKGILEFQIQRAESRNDEFQIDQEKNGKDEFQIDLVINKKDDLQIDLAKSRRDEFQIDLENNEKDEFLIDLVINGKDEFSIDLTKSGRDEFQIDLAKIQKDGFSIDLAKNGKAELQIDLVMSAKNELSLIENCKVSSGNLSQKSSQIENAGKKIEMLKNGQFEMNETVTDGISDDQRQKQVNKYLRGKGEDEANVYEKRNGEYSYYDGHFREDYRQNQLYQDGYKRRKWNRQMMF